MGDSKMGLRTVFVNDKVSARQLRKAKLVVIEGPDEGTEYDISKNKTFVGRAAINDITLSDSSVSGTHFEVRAEENGFLLKDVGSTNGTHLGGCRVKEVWIEPNVSFSAGNSTFKIQSSEEFIEIPLSEDEHFQGVIGRSVAMREVFALLAKIAPSELTCMIEGDTGTGKERVARAIHDASRRSKKPYVVLDCSSIPKDLMESYVFGHEKGAFTGAVGQHKGAFEQAHGGTLFMDEIGELDITLQPKLLRVLENREFKRVGGTQTNRADVRVIAATNRDLRQMVNEGTFREDLYFRLSVINVHLPSLAARPDDIPLLVDTFVDQIIAKRPDLSKPRLTADALDLLLTYDWPGNVRELKNVVDRAVSLATDNIIDRSDLQLRGAINPTAGSAPLGQAAPVANAPVDLSVPYKDAKQVVVDRFEAAYLSVLMEKFKGNISRASKDTGLTRYHLRELLKKHGLK